MVTDNSTSGLADRNISDFHQKQQLTTSPGILPWCSGRSRIVLRGFVFLPKNIWWPLFSRLVITPSDCIPLLARISWPCFSHQSLRWFVFFFTCHYTSPNSIPPYKKNSFKNFFVSEGDLSAPNKPRGSAPVVASLVNIGGSLQSVLCDVLTDRHTNSFYNLSNADN